MRFDLYKNRKYTYNGKLRVRDEEDVYAARIGRLMWRLAKRRAAKASLLASSVFGVKTAAASVTVDNRDVQSPPPLPEDAFGSEHGPNSLSEFLQELAGELAEDDQDRDES